MAAWIGIGASLVAGAYWMNPAFALLGCMAVRLGLQTNPIPSALNSSKLGKMSLQTAIVLLGLTLGADRLIDVSAEYGIAVAVYVLGTLAIGWVLAILFRRRTATEQLLSGGTAICGGTAIATLAPILRAAPHEFAVSTALVFLLNVVALLTFPTIGAWLDMSQATFGAWVALAVHDTSSVVATASLYGVEAQEVATTVKLGRTLWLIPLAFVASLAYRGADAKLRVPTFVLMFVAAAVVATFVPIGPDIQSAILLISKLLLVLALGMIGLDIDRETLSQLSAGAVLYGSLLWLIVAPLSLLLVWYL